MKAKDALLKEKKSSYKKEMEKKNLAKSKNNKENRKRMNSQRMRKNGLRRNWNLKQKEPSQMQQAHRESFMESHQTLSLR